MAFTMQKTKKEKQKQKIKENFSRQECYKANGKDAI